MKFLGFSFYMEKGETRIRIHPKSVAKMKAKVKEHTARSNGLETKNELAVSDATSWGG